MEEEKDIEEDLKPSFSLTGEMSVLNEEPELLAKPLFNEEESDSEIIPDENESERGNASAIIISIIAVYAVVFITMIYSSRKMKKGNIIEALRDDNI